MARPQAGNARKTTASTALAIRDAGRAAMEQQRQRGEELLALIRRRLAEVTDSFYEIGEALGEIANNRMYVALGHDSMAELLEAEGFMSMTQAGKLISVATLVPREDAVRLGPEKSYAVTRYAHVTGTDTRALLVGKATVDGVRVADLSVAQLRDVTRKVSEDHRPRSAERQKHTQSARVAQAALRKRGLSSAQAAAVRRRGGWVFTVTLDEEDLAKLAGRGVLG